MVTTEYIIRSALQHDTVVARAFLRACGVPVAPMPQPTAPVIVELDTAQEIEQDILWAFKNTHSPMDWLTDA